MAPSLRWLLLLWGLQGLWAQDFDGRYEEERLAARRRNAQLPSNVIPKNGQCKSMVMWLDGEWWRRRRRRCRTWCSTRASAWDTVRFGRLSVSHPAPAWLLSVLLPKCFIHTSLRQHVPSVKINQFIHSLHHIRDVPPHPLLPARDLFQNFASHLQTAQHLSLRTRSSIIGLNSR